MNLSKPIAFIFLLFIQLCGVSVSADDGAHEEKTGKKWLDMDYGPYLSAAIEVSSENFAYKGIAIPLSRNWDGEHDESVLFDINLLRYSAGWQEGFIELNGIVFDGRHGVHPKIDGEPVWVTQPIPGWGKFGSFVDPRSFPYNHLPSDWGHWKGLYLHNNKVILSYEVNGTSILDMPSLTHYEDVSAFTRTIHMKKRDIEHTVEILYETNSSPQYLSADTLKAMDGNADETLVVFDRQSSNQLSVGAKGTPTDSRWVMEEGHLRLVVPPQNHATQFDLFVWNGEETQLKDFSDLVKNSKQSDTLLDYTNGGPRRWEENLNTQGSPLQFTSKANQYVFEPSDETQLIQVANIADGDAMLLSHDTHDSVDFPAPVNNTIFVHATSKKDNAQIQNTLSDLQEYLIGYWTFDEGSGDTAYIQEGSAGNIQLNETRWRRGLVGRSLEFEGIGNAVIENADAVDLRDTDLSITCWVNTEFDGSIFSKTLPDHEWVPGGISLFVRDGNVTFDMGWVGDLASSHQKVNDGKWHHIALLWSHDSSSAVLYVDGKNPVEREFPMNPGWNLDDHIVQLGYTSKTFPQEKYFSGKIDELRIYNKKLSFDEIQSMIASAGVRIAEMYGVAGDEPEVHWVQNNDTVSLQMPPSNQANSMNMLKHQGFYSDLEDFSARLSRLENELNMQNKSFSIMEVTDPEQNPWDSWMRFGGFDFFSDGDRAAVCTWSGDVWTVEGIEDDMSHLSWQRIATGLHQPLGLKIVDDEIYVIDRNQLTRLHDLNGDEEIDFYENFNYDIMNSEHFHEPCMELQTDEDGNFYTMKGAQHGLPARHPYHGTLVKISNDGKTSKIVARGFRASNGVCLDGNGVLYGTDQEGHWMPANKITRIQPGEFHGNQWAWVEEIRVDNFVQPAIWLHPSIDRSPSSFVWIDDEWEPFRNHLISLSYGRGTPFLVLQENVNGIMQGGVTPLPMEFPTGIMRGRFHPHDGDLYLCGLFGWSADNQYPGGFYRVKMNAEVMNVPVNFHAVQDGIILRFLEPLDKMSSQNASNYTASAWNYRWSEKYGSPDINLDGDEGRTHWEIKEATLSNDRKSVFLKINEIEPAMQVHVEFDMNANDHARINSYVHGTIHEVASISGGEFLTRY